MSLFRRMHEAVAPPPPPPEPDTDSPDALRRGLDSLIAFVNQSSGRLPSAAVVAARRVTDAVAEVIDTSAHAPLDIQTVLSVRHIVEDYLPTTLRAYLALDADAPQVRRADAGRALLEQLDALWTGTGDLLEAARGRDVDALLAQGRFLHAKFTGSDLDL